MKRKLLVTVLVTLVAGLSAIVIQRDQVQASPADLYSPAAPYFGSGNLPPGCENDELVGSQMDRGSANAGNVCHHMRTDMNGLDSSQVDVLVMVPASPTVERDMRIMRQSVEMWEGGIDYLSEQMGLNWLTDGMDFHITVESFDPAGDGGGEFTTYPVVDPEIVVIATNPVGGAGIGIDPVDAVFVNEDFAPCLPVANPLDFEQWENVPGFNSHHESRSGTYVEDCASSAGKTGGNICFAINGAVDPAPGAVDDGSVFGAFPFSLFDLVSHEFGHCLTIGHVGDGLEGSWGGLPSNDIMAYHDDPPGINKCVSTLDVESIALRMSKYIDVNGDGAVNATDLLEANDQAGEGGNPFQIQHPRDHLYASGTGSPLDCPQPDLGTLPGPRTDWTPTPVKTVEPTLTITGPADGSVSDTGVFDITGTVENVSLITDPDPTETTGHFDDADDDATSPLTEILDLDVGVSDTHVTGTLRLSEVWPVMDGASPTNYSLEVDGRRFDSFVYGVGFVQPRTWDDGAGVMMPNGTSTWDSVAKTVKFEIPRAYLEGVGVAAPYELTSESGFGNALTAVVADDSAPENGESIGVAGPRAASLHLPGGIAASSNATTVTFENPAGNTFYPEQSTLGVNRGTAHSYSLNVADPSTVKFVLDWTDAIGGADLDLNVTGAANSGAQGATTDRPETFTLESVVGALAIKVDPYFVTDPLSGSTYTLTATVTPDEVVLVDTDLDGILDVNDRCPTESGIAPSGCPDTDGDGVVDLDDVCPSEVGEGADGCPILPTEFVTLWVGGAVAATDVVDTANGPDSFSLPVALAEGTFELRVDWERDGRLLTSRFITLTHDSDDDDDGVDNEFDRCPGFDDFDDTDRDGVPDGCDTDTDGDGTADHRDNCPDLANADQANLDGDAKGDACDSDIDGDGHSNGKERAHGTSPMDPNDFPGKPKKGIGL